MFSYLIFLTSETAQLRRCDFKLMCHVKEVILFGGKELVTLRVETDCSFCKY